MHRRWKMASTTSSTCRWVTISRERRIHVVLTECGTQSGHICKSDPVVPTRPLRDLRLPQGVQGHVIPMGSQHAPTKAHDMLALHNETDSRVTQEAPCENKRGSDAGCPYVR